MRLPRWTLLLLLLAWGGPWLWPVDPLVQHLGTPFSPPDPSHPLGLDAIGRDLLARLLEGVRRSVSIAGAATVLSLLLGCLLGFAAGWRRGLTDLAIRWHIDLFLTLPLLLVAMFVATALPAGQASHAVTLVLLLGLVSWMGTARLVRAHTLQCLASPWFQQARAHGVPMSRLVVRWVLPPLGAVLGTQAWLVFLRCILTEATLSYFGLGPPVPHPSWGALIAEGREVSLSAPWQFWVPVVCLVLFMGSLSHAGPPESGSPARKAR